MRRRSFVGGLAAAGLASPAIGQDAIKMRISLDTSAAHTRTQQMTRFAEELKKRSSGKLAPEVFHSAQLFRDRDVAKALRQGGVEMGAPGPWNMTGIESNLDLFQAPTFYGRTREEIYRISDGDVGRELNAMMEKRIGVKVPGKWLDLGSAHTFSTNALLNSSDDMKGLKVRTSGGAGQFLRVRFFGGVPNFTAWPDVPLALSQGTFDALITTNESCVSAKLWEAGVKNTVQDYQFFAQYIPMIAAPFWSKLPGDLQAVITKTWDEMVGGFRDEMARSQAHALEVMKEKGMRVVEQTKQQFDDSRKRLMASQDDVVKELKLDAALVQKANAAFDIGGKS
jgi:TRAP-type C4-dicarboxylate transport system substrate-binding protein